MTPDMTLPSQRLYAKNPGYVTANLGEELAVLDMTSGSYLGFNATAAEVWRLLEAPHSVETLCAALTSQFEVEHDRCREAVTNLLDKLSAAGLLRTWNAEAD